jgi:hypothetical protein
MLTSESICCYGEQLQRSLNLDEVDGLGAAGLGRPTDRASKWHLACRDGARTSSSRIVFRIDVLIDEPSSGSSRLSSSQGAIRTRLGP